VKPTKHKFKGWLFWFIAALFYAYEFLHRVAPSVLTGQLREAFSINDHQLANIGAMYFYAYALFQLPAGVIVDRFGAKRLLITASSILTLGSFLFASTTSSLVAHISRFMIGTGSAFAFIGCLKIGSQWLPHRSFPLIVGLTNFLGTLGALSGGAPLAYLVHQFGWREALMYVSFGGLSITLLLWFFLQEKKTNIASSHPPHLLTGLRLVAKNPQSWLIALYGALLVAPIISLPELWADEYLEIAYQLSSTQAATITHTIFIGTAIGGPLIGWALSRVSNKIYTMRLASLGAGILLSIFLYWHPLPLWTLYFILLGYGFLTANMLLCFTLITERHPPWAQGAAIGFTNMLIMAFGGFMQDRIGWILKILRNDQLHTFLMKDYHIAFSLLPCCFLLAIGITFFIKK